VVGHEKEINVVKYSPNEKLIATGSQDKGIKIWDVKKLENIMTLTGHKRGVWDLSFS
jgi:U3 small nucleolar RNA-associated protein 13